jgi:hypothetical protein
MQLLLVPVVVLAEVLLRQEFLLPPLEVILFLIV